MMADFIEKEKNDSFDAYFVVATLMYSYLLLSFFPYSFLRSHFLRLAVHISKLMILRRLIINLRTFNRTLSHDLSSYKSYNFLHLSP